MLKLPGGVTWDNKVLIDIKWMYRGPRNLLMGSLKICSQVIILRVGRIKRTRSAGLFDVDTTPSI